MVSSVGGEGQPQGNPKPDADGILPSREYSVLGTATDGQGSTIVRVNEKAWT